MWRVHPILQQTWTQFKINFSTAHCNVYLQHTTACQAGFGSNDAANGTIEEASNMANVSNKFCCDTTDGLANLSTATEAYCSAMAYLTQSNTTLNSSLIVDNTNITLLQVTISGLQHKIASLNISGGGHGRGHGDGGHGEGGRDNGRRCHNRYGL